MEGFTRASEAASNGVRLTAHWIEDAVARNEASGWSANAESGEELGVEIVECLQEGHGKESATCGVFNGACIGVGEPQGAQSGEAEGVQENASIVSGWCVMGSGFKVQVACQISWPPVDTLQKDVPEPFWVSGKRGEGRRAPKGEHGREDVLQIGRVLRRDGAFIVF